MSTRLNNRFTVPVPVDRAWDVLMDVERIAPCMPGATLESVEGDTMTGKVRVKVGPITVTYRGEAHFTEVNEEERRVELHAGGKEARGTGTASATVTAQLFEDGDGSTEVEVDTDFTVTGRVAQFGRGVMADVSAKLVAKFAENLAAELQGGSPEEPRREEARTGAVGGSGSSQSASGSSAGTHAGEPKPATGEQQESAASAESAATASSETGLHAGTHSPVRTDMRSDSPGMRARDDSIDLVSTVGMPLLKRALPVLGVAAVLAVVFGWLRRRRRDR
ncbi:SRPBCC family protein [Streptomonospora litoralis]|uniref:Carbon monoxide dehydrogenase subunit G (CoxG) n=1 Tax=Streptomonospora litoralis TaxID=2498135 RepID=A0A4P6PWC2_9ACTN|nr:SRPBCC family protein [Streptomonospora litoralis]QBI52373.1 Carbon monoxide dehydrogenase subunit G (CoxG) [Streptomonospora litoralis]